MQRQRKYCESCSKGSGKKVTNHNTSECTRKCVHCWESGQGAVMFALCVSHCAVCERSGLSFNHGMPECTLRCHETECCQGGKPLHLARDCPNKVSHPAVYPSDAATIILPASRPLETPEKSNAEYRTWLIDDAYKRLRPDQQKSGTWFKVKGVMESAVMRGERGQALHDVLTDWVGEIEREAKRLGKDPKNMYRSFVITALRRSIVDSCSQENGQTSDRTLAQSSQKIVYKKNKDCTVFFYFLQVVTALYRTLTPKRRVTTFSEITDSVAGGAGVGYTVHRENPDAVLGMMIAANNGLPGGSLGRRPAEITEADLSIRTQEESMWANAVLTECGSNSAKQEQFHRDTIQDQWGLEDTGFVTTTGTIQGIDFVNTTDVMSYNQAYVVTGHSLSNVVGNRRARDLHIQNGSQYPVLFVFADCVNTGRGSSTGSMSRTRNIKASSDYEFYNECRKMKLRASLDAMAQHGVTVPLVALLGCGVNGYEHKREPLVADFKKILQDVLDEEVGPNREKRGEYFDDVILPLIE